MISSRRDLMPRAAGYDPEVVLEATYGGIGPPMF